MNETQVLREITEVARVLRALMRPEDQDKNPELLVRFWEAFRAASKLLDAPEPPARTDTERLLAVLEVARYIDNYAPFIDMSESTAKRLRDAIAAIDGAVMNETQVLRELIWKLYLHGIFSVEDRQRLLAMLDAPEPPARTDTPELCACATLCLGPNRPDLDRRCFLMLPRDQRGDRKVKGPCRCGKPTCCGCASNPCMCATFRLDEDTAPPAPAAPRRFIVEFKESRSVAPSENEYTGDWGPFYVRGEIHEPSEQELERLEQVYAEAVSAQDEALTNGDVRSWAVLRKAGIRAVLKAALGGSGGGE